MFDNKLRNLTFLGSGKLLEIVWLLLKIIGILKMSTLQKHFSEKTGKYRTKTLKKSR